MRLVDGTLLLSPTDISSFLACRHRTGLELAAAHKVLDKPRFEDPYAAILARHGTEHEERYVASLKAGGFTTANAKPADRTPSEESLRLTLEAMRAGVDVIVQARLEDGGVVGYADILRKVDKPSDLGAWSYEAHDTKLSHETKGGTILQLSAYSHMLEGMQGVLPDAFHVVTPVTAERYLVAEFAAYYRLVRRMLDAELTKGHEQIIADHYPEPVDGCQMCAWEARCDARRRQDDHLSYIAGSSRTHRIELIAQGVPTLTAAAQMAVPVAFRPTRGARETYDRLGNQARVQHQQHTERRPIVEQLPIEKNKGLCRLPAPSTGDIFLDLEGAAFAREGGREYLIGFSNTKGAYTAKWAFDDEQERRAFEEVMDTLTAAAKDDPAMHIYHFNHYETTAFKKLASRYVTRVDELDELLSAERFVDLYPIVRQAVRAGVESYSIKKLEQYYSFTRAVALANVHLPLMAIENALDAKAPDAITKEIRDVVQGYNEDDCKSTLALRNWLEELRAGSIATGVDVPRPTIEEKERRQDQKELQIRAQVARARLLEDLPAEAATPSHPSHARWLLAYLVDWHKREINAEWWEFFRLRDLPEEDLFDERKAVAGLQWQKTVQVVTNVKTGRPTGSVIDRYTYPSQDIELKGKLFLPTGKQFGTMEAHDRTARTIDIKKGQKIADIHPTALYTADVVGNSTLQESIVRLAESPSEATGDLCGIQLLQSRPPRLRTGAFAIPDGESAQEYAVRISVDLDRTVLPIQGPPGAGKTFIGAQMIRELARAGRKVGVTANSHKVIQNLLDEVVAQAKKAGETVTIGAKTRGDDDEDSGGPIVAFDENEDALNALAAGEIKILGGTAWLWADPDAANAVDVLFVDEAGQMSLANVLAVSPAANSLVLLGDPQQLDQPGKGTHPDGVGVSALEHVLGGHATMPVDRGIFLPVTWRMSPTLTSFTSELFYEGKLAAKDGLDRQVLAGVDGVSGSRLWIVPVEHEGNQSASDEEVAAVANLVDRLLATGSTWIDEKGAPQPLTAADLRVVAPFNAQVNRLSERLSPLGVQVGTVDKFQGQTCAVVIYSMATSRPEDAPRGLEFLYSLNRLNVATSRARCAVFIVASPRLFEPDCRTPRQMKLANALCRYAEMAEAISVS